MNQGTKKRNGFTGRTLVLTAAVMGANIAGAQQPPNTLKDAIERAAVQNPEVKLRFHNLEAAIQERKVASGAWMPSLDLEAASGRYETLRPSLSSPLGYDGNRASLQLRQVLFNGMATASEVRRLDYAQQAAFYELQSTSNAVGLEVARAYLDVLRYRDLVTLAASNYKTHLEVRDRLEQKVSAGVGRKVDLEQANGRMALAESNWLTESSNLHDVTARYLRLIGDLPTNDLAAPTLPKMVIASTTSFLSDAVHRNPDFLGAVSTIRAYRADAAVRKSTFAPTVELRARQSVETNQSGVQGNYRDSTLELVLNYNLFRGGSDKARFKQYLYKLESAFDLRDKACRDIWQTGQIAVNDHKRLDNQIQLLAQHELSTSKARQAYMQQFDIGQRSLLDLLDTENELYQARRALANAEFDQQLSEFRLLAINGSLLSALQLQALTAAETTQPDSGTEADDALMVCSQQIPVEVQLDRTIEPRAVPVEPPAAPVVPKAPPPPAPAPAPDLCASLPQMVQNWIGAWNTKQTANYLSYYASNFTPAMGLSRGAWENLRKKRITKQGDIKAVISDIKPLSCNATSAEVAFKQDYGSLDYNDQVEKTLSLEVVEGRWKILRETVTKGRTF